MNERALALALACALAVACSENGATRTIDAPVGSDDAGLGDDPCAQREDGTACNDARFCRGGECLPNVCGDGLRAGDERCDDGNFARGDGCSPSCEVELEVCPDGHWVRTGDPCKGAVPLVDGGADPYEGERCPIGSTIIWSRRLATVTTPLGVAKVLPGDESIGLAPRMLGTAGGVTWVVREPGSAWTTANYDQAGALETTFRCTEDHTVDYEIAFIVSRPDCPSSVVNAFIQCAVEEDVPPPAMDSGLAASTPDAGRTDAGAADGSLPDAALPDGSTPDAGTSDAGAPDFRNEECRRCVQSACTDYAGIDLVTPCLRNADARFAAECSSTFFCSHNAPDGCGDNSAEGPAGCFCGVPLEIDACQASASNVHGLCRAEWYSASRCPSGDQRCALDSFTNGAVPAFYANFLLECLNTSCGEQCAR